MAGHGITRSQFESVSHSGCAQDSSAVGDVSGSPSGDELCSPVSLESQIQGLIEKLIRLAHIYAERAMAPEVVRECSAKEASGIIKTTAETIKILQEPIWHCIPRSGGRELSASGNGNRPAHLAPHSAISSQRRSFTNPRADSLGKECSIPANADAPSSETPAKPLTIDMVYELIEGAVYEVAQMEEETRELEGWARLLVRCDSLVKKIAQAIVALGADTQTLIGDDLLKGNSGKARSHATPTRKRDSLGRFVKGSSSVDPSNSPRPP